MNIKHKFEDYRFEIRPLLPDDGGGFVITFPDLPGCMSDGETYDDAISNARDAFVEWIASREEAGQEIPVPDAITKPTKFLLRLPKSVHENAAALARVEGTSLNTLYALLISEAIAFRAGRFALQARTSGVEASSFVPLLTQPRWAYWALEDSVFARSCTSPAVQGTITTAQDSLTTNATELLVRSLGSFGSEFLGEVVPVKGRALS